jgi:hypothetical protein
MKYLHNELDSEILLALDNYFPINKNAYNQK